MTLNNASTEYQIEILNACERRITISVPLHKVEQELKQVQKNYMDQLTLKPMHGYRPGKIAKHHTNDIKAQAQEKLIQSSFEECLKKENLKLASQPEFTDLQTEPFRYTVSFEIYPSIPCPKLTDVTLDGWETSITEEEIDQVLSSIPNQAEPTDKLSSENNHDAIAEESTAPEVDQQKKSEEDNTQLRLRVRQWMESRANNVQREELKKQIIDHLLEQNPISELPQKLLEQHYLRLKRNQPQTSSEEHNTEAEADQLRTVAKRQVMLTILFETYAAEHNIQLDVNRVNTSMAEIAMTFQHQPELLEKMKQDKNFINLLCSQVLEEQIIDHLLQQITLVKKPKSYTELMNLGSNQENHTHN